MAWGLHMVGDAALVLAVAGVGYTLAAGRALRHLDRRTAPHGATAAGASPAMVVLKPLHGVEPDLEADLQSLIDQVYPGPVRILLGVQDARDGALPLALRLAERNPGRVGVVVDPRPHGSNRKVSNLINLLTAAQTQAPIADQDLVVISDSDIRVPPRYLQTLADAAARPGVGAVTCYYRGRAAQGGWPARLSAMGISYAFLPLVALAVDLGEGEPCMGSTIALRRSVLREIGDFAGVADVLADDYEIGRQVRRRGYTLALPPMVVDHSCDETGFAELWRHEMRWQATIRGLNTLGYFGSIVTHPVPLALIGAALTGLAWPGVTVLAGAFAARLWLKRRVDRITGESSGPWWLTPARDILSLAVFAAAAPARRVEWRGARFHVGRDGALSPVLR